MGRVALEIPLGLFAFGRGGERDDATRTRIQPLRDALDCATFARGIAAFKDHDNLRLGVLNPVLQFDEFGLQCKKMLKVFRTLDRRRVTGLVDLSDFLRQGWLGQFELNIFVQRVSQLCLKPIIAVRTFVHFSSADGKPLAESKLRSMIATFRTQLTASISQTVRNLWI